MKAIFALLAATFLSTLIVQPSVSQRRANTQVHMETPRLVSYLGTRNEMLVFELTLNFKDNEIKTLSILDDAGNEIHTERIKVNVFTKRYMFAYTTAGKIQFKLRGKKEIMNETFQINYKTEEKLEITKA